MPTIERHKWTAVEQLSEDGHRLFTKDNGDLALADNSGHTPDDTDDGPVYLDLSCERLPTMRNPAPGEGGSPTFLIPVNCKGEETWTPVPPSDFFALTVRFYGGISVGTSKREGGMPPEGLKHYVILEAE